MGRKPHSRASRNARDKAHRAPHQCDPLRFHRIQDSGLYACGCGTRWRFVPGAEPFTGDWRRVRA